MSDQDEGFKLSRARAALGLCACAGLAVLVGFLWLSGWSGGGLLWPLCAATVLFTLCSIAAWRWTALGLACEEAQRQEKLMTGRSASLFEEGQMTQVAQARRSLRYHERLLLPFLNLVLVLSLGAFAWWWHGQPAAAHVPTNLVPAGALTLAWAAGAFVMAAFIAGLGRDLALPALRATAGFAYWMSLVALLSALAAFVLAAADPAGELAPRLVHWIVTGGKLLLVMLAVDLAIVMILERLRPQVREGKSFCLESRSILLLVSPGGLVAKLVHAVDYQFGLKITERSTRDFLVRSLTPVLLLQLLLFYLTTTFVEIAPGRQGLRESCGRAGALLESGVHFKLPWPFGRIHVVDTTAVSSLDIGQVLADGDAAPPSEDAATPDVLLWTRTSHADLKFKDFSFLTRAPSQGSDAGAGLLTMIVDVKYRVVDVKKYLYEAGAAERGPDAVREHLRILAESALTAHLACHDADELMGARRQPLEEDFKQRLSAEMSGRGRGLGVGIVSVSVGMIHPPAAVASAFDQYMAAEYQAQSQLAKARIQARQELVAAQSQAQQARGQARVEADEHVALAAAKVQRFAIQQALYKQSPDIFTLFSYLEMFEQGNPSLQRYIFNSPDTARTMMIDFKEDQTRRLLDELKFESSDKKANP